MKQEPVQLLCYFRVVFIVVVLKLHRHSRTGVRRGAYGPQCCMQWHVSMSVRALGYSYDGCGFLVVVSFISLPTYYSSFHVLLSCIT